MTGQFFSKIFVKFGTWKINRENLHFWEKYWIFLASTFMGMIIGFGLSGESVKPLFPIIIVSWLGLLIFSRVARKMGEKI